MYSLADRKQHIHRGVCNTIQEVYGQVTDVDRAGGSSRYTHQ